jgi:hypothetical protein
MKENLVGHILPGNVKKQQLVALPCRCNHPAGHVVQFSSIAVDQLDTNPTIHDGSLVRRPT